MQDCSTYILPCDLREADPRLLQLGTVLLHPTDTFLTTHLDAQRLARAAKVGIHTYVERNVQVMQPLLFDEVNYLFPVHPNKVGTFKANRQIPRHLLTQLEVVHFTDPPSGKEVASMLKAHPVIKAHLELGVVNYQPVYMVTGLMIASDMQYRERPAPMPTRTPARAQDMERKLVIEPEAREALTAVLEKSKRHQDKELPLDFFQVSPNGDSTTPRRMEVDPLRIMAKPDHMVAMPGKTIYAYKLTKIDVSRWMGSVAKPVPEPVLTKQGYMVRYRDVPVGHVYTASVEVPATTNFDCVYGGW
ncbi:hypothetical protein JDV02_000008 [Purpureocillium takamizusanense]|uniref:Uncharacterized protein n=1 Tax=Purpureocillium takamizusanense TaxID=2060973 RepID=A0A9Q8V6E8_9HYPO|nr:uncharacterized protein JDV02_000008 [Purpureocillium takamizusanense]UNI13251.1 hypothetical protein JDV02_000008 [Purpureocillium takamizusanense]